MKIAVCSDIHLEFGTISLDNTEGADVLILLAALRRGIHSFKNALLDSLMLSTSLEITNIITVILGILLQGFVISLVIYAIYIS